jgi:hypothetical protein
MNDTILTQLKILVERAVRPVRASISRKRKMREELLAHVSAVFEEEAKQSDEAAALTRTRERFGSPAQLSQQLQATVPASDAPFYFVESITGCPSHESVWRRAARYAFTVAVASTFCLTILMLAMTPREEWLTIARLPSVLAPVWMAFLTFCATLLEHGMRRALFDPRGRNWRQAFAVGMATWLLVPALVFVWSIAVTGGFLSSVQETWPLLVSSLLAPAAAVLVSRVCVAEIRYLEEWANLSID